MPYNNLLLVVGANILMLSEIKDNEWLLFTRGMEHLGIGDE